MRQCVYNANLIEDIYSGKLQFATESEATAIYCLKDYFKCGIGETFMFVDCGKCTTDLTTQGYCDEPGVNRLGILNIDLSDVQLDCRSIIFGLTFGKDEIIALARNELNRQEHMATFCYPDDDF
ncbi:unnamed protein product [Rhizophagus irregularis]|nr:unnamed protein product [Rhizophagus irregularis]